MDSSPAPLSATRPARTASSPLTASASPTISAVRHFWYPSLCDTTAVEARLETPRAAPDPATVHTLRPDSDAASTIDPRSRFLTISPWEATRYGPA